MAKRDNGTGTIYQRQNGGWVGRIYLGRDESGKEKFPAAVLISFHDL